MFKMAEINKISTWTLVQSCLRCLCQEIRFIGQVIFQSIFTMMKFSVWRKNTTLYYRGIGHDIHKNANFKLFNVKAALWNNLTSKTFLTKYEFSWLNKINQKTLNLIFLHDNVLIWMWHPQIYVQQYFQLL